MYIPVNSTKHTATKIWFVPLTYTDNHHNNEGGERENHIKNQSSSQVASPQADVNTDKQKVHIVTTL